MLNVRFFFVLFTCILLLNTSCSSARRSDDLHQPLQAGITSDYESSKSVAALTYPAQPLIIIDAGHGGTDEGAKMNSILEKRITLMTALLTKKSLEEMGYRVILTRSRDVYISLARRVSIANKTKSSLFVSIHYNASRNKSAKGIEIYYCDSKEKWRARASRRLANCILFQLLDQTEARSRGVKEGNFHVIRETQMPAVLVEGGFVTNGEERSMLKDREYLKRISAGIAQGIDKYFKS